MNLSKIRNLKRFSSKGFTLIELLIVVAILGVMAAAVLIAIDPAAKIKAAKDATARSDMGQLGNALQAYNSIQLRYPLNAGNPGAPGLQDLITTGELKSLPRQQATAFTCAPGPDGITTGTNYCYTSTASSGQAAALWGAMYSGATGDYFCWDSTSSTTKKCNAALARPTQALPFCNASCTTP